MGKKKPPRVPIRLFGIWEKQKYRVVFISLSLEDVETEYDLEGYTEDTHVIVCLDSEYDISSLG